MNTPSALLTVAAILALAAVGPAGADEEMALHWVMDPEASMPVYGFRGPGEWKFHSVVQWNLANSSNPVIAGSVLTNPDIPERIHFMPNVMCYWLTGDAANNPGGTFLGMLNVAPMVPTAALASAVRTLHRNDVPDLQITGVRELPGLPAALNQSPKDYKGVGLRAVYSIDGTKVEEEIYGLYYLTQASLRGEVGVTTQTTWGLSHVHGFTTPIGKMDDRRSFFTYMVRSVVINPAWVRFHGEVKEKLDQEFARKIGESRAAREAIMARSRALAAENEAFRGRIMARHRAAMDSGNHHRFIAGIHESGAHDKFIDSIHEVETLKDPQWGTSKHAYAKQHWTDGWGGYIHSDDVSYDPNIGSKIEWQRMTPAE